MAAIQIPEEQATRFGAAIEIALHKDRKLAYGAAWLIAAGLGTLICAGLASDQAFSKVMTGITAVLILAGIAVGAMFRVVQSRPDFVLRVLPDSIDLPIIPAWTGERALVPFKEISKIELGTDSNRDPILDIHAKDRVHRIPDSWVGRPWSLPVLGFHLQLRHLLRNHPPDALAAAEAQLLTSDTPTWGALVVPRGPGVHAVLWVFHSPMEYQKLQTAGALPPEHKVLVLEELVPGIEAGFRKHAYRKLAAELKPPASQEPPSEPSPATAT